MDAQYREEDDSTLSQLTSYRIAQQHGMLTFKFTSQVEIIVPLPDYEGLVIFDDGKICKVNFLHETILNTGLIDRDIKNVVLYDNTTIAFTSYSQKRVGFFDFVKFQLTQPLIINLPTELGMPISERTELAMEDLFRDGMRLIVLPESKFLVLLEIKSTYQHQSENVISAFHESKPTEIFSQVKYSEPRWKEFFMEPLNKCDTICVYSQNVENLSVEFLIWNISKKAEGLIAQFKLTDVIEGVIQTVFQFSETTAGVIINTSDQQKPYPMLKVFDFTQGSPAKEITTILDVVPQKGIKENTSNPGQIEYFPNDSRSFCLQDIILTDVAAQKIIWSRLGQGGEYFDVYNPKSNKIVFEYFLKSNSSRDDEDNNDISWEDKKPSVNKKYILSYVSQMNELNETNKQDLLFMISSIVEVKTTILYLLMQKDILQLYGEEVCKNIVDMLTNSETE